MRIAVTYEKEQIFQHFGHTSLFKIFDVEDGKIVKTMLAPTMGSGHGALAGFLAACFGASPVVQIVLFVVISVVLLIFTRPIVRRIFSFGIKDTNNQEIGRIAVVIQTVDPIHNTGRVRLDGVDWIAVSQDGTVIPESTSVRIEAISGTKLLVSRLPQTEEQTVNN